MNQELQQRFLVCHHHVVVGSNTLIGSKRIVLCIFAVCVFFAYYADGFSVYRVTALKVGVGSGRPSHRRRDKPCCVKLQVAVDPLHDQQNQNRNSNNNSNNNSRKRLSSNPAKGNVSWEPRNVSPVNRRVHSSSGSVVKSFHSRHTSTFDTNSPRNSVDGGMLLSSGIRSAEVIEERLASSLERLRTAVSAKNNTPLSATTTTASIPDIFFPTVRECNEALAAFGDAGDLLRALRMFGKMRKLIVYVKRNVNDPKHLPGDRSSSVLPVPSLVTYSTLMSRAVKSHKPRVALRLWNLMISSSSSDSDTTTTNTNNNNSKTKIIPDVKAANILMNCYAKLANVKRAQDLLTEMKTGKGDSGSPLLLVGQTIVPNLVTLNTLLNACQKAGDLDAALQAKAELDALGIRPDARTYTSLIATVARGPSRQAGKNDPTFAFDLLQEMNDRGIQPNGMTYSALIDACGRCRRSDLALQGLRIMMRQKTREQKLLQQQQQQRYGSSNLYQSYSLPNEVGAWTAAIDACGKSNRIETAIKLFYNAMPNLGRCEPNQVTCGCLMDSLLRAGRTAETLDVLRYMKRKGIAPSEVMYTSLMTRAERLVQMEETPSWSSSLSVPIHINIKSLNYYNSNKESSSFATSVENDHLGSNEASGTKAIQVYTELIKSLVDTTGTIINPKNQQSFRNKASSTTISPTGVVVSNQYKRDREQREEDNNVVLVKVFLVFRQMQALGAKPDIACYNALLQACARAGEFEKGMRLLQDEILNGCSSSASNNNAYDLEPNDGTWRELLRAASLLKRSDWALQVWRKGQAYQSSSSAREKGNHHHNNNNNNNPQVTSTTSSELLDHHQSSTPSWIPSMSSFCELLLSFLRHAQHCESRKEFSQAQPLYETVIQYYVAIVKRDRRSNNNSSSSSKGKKKDEEETNSAIVVTKLVDRQALLDNRRAMLFILQAAVALRQSCYYGATTKQGQAMKQLSMSILQMETFRELLATPKDQRPRLAWSSVQSLEMAESWLVQQQQLRP